MIDFSALDNAVRYKKPSDPELIQYLFWQQGISWIEFQELPIPYILTILKVHTYVKKEEEKAYKKQHRKK